MNEPKDQYYVIHTISSKLISKRLASVNSSDYHLIYSTAVPQ